MSQYDRRTAQAVLGLNVRYLIYPIVTGVPAVGAVSTTQAGAWSAAYTDIVAAAAVLTEFWVCGFMVNTAGAFQIYECQVADATPAVLSEFRFDLTAVTPNLGYFPAGPFPIAMAAQALVQYRAGAAAAKVIGVTALIAVGL